MASPIGEPGKIRDAKLNRREAIRVLRQWVEFQGGLEVLQTVKVMSLSFDMRGPGGVHLGDSRMISTADGRFRMESRRPDAAQDAYALSAVWDGETHWQDRNGKIEISKGDDARTGRDIAIGHILALVRLQKDLDSQFKRVVLQGSGKRR